MFNISLKTNVADFGCYNAIYLLSVLFTNSHQNKPVLDILLKTEFYYRVPSNTGVSRFFTVRSTLDIFKVFEG